MNLQRAGHKSTANEAVEIDGARSRGNKNTKDTRVVVVRIDPLCKLAKIRFH